MVGVVFIFEFVKNAFEINLFSCSLHLPYVRVDSSNNTNTYVCGKALDVQKLWLWSLLLISKMGSRVGQCGYDGRTDSMTIPTSEMLTQICKRLSS